MKKLLLLFALVLTVCSTAMAQDLNVGSAVGTIGTLDGRKAMVVDLGGTIGKVAVATRNVGAEKASDKMAMITEGTKFNLADANNPEKNGLTDGWYVPSKAELEALKGNLTPNKGVHCVEWKVTETATLYLPTWSAGSNLYYGKYASSDREQVDDTWKCWIYEYLFYDSESSFGGNDLEECDEQETENCLIRPFHKLPDIYYIDADGVSHNVNAYEVSSSDDQITWGEAGKESWYIVKGNDVTLSQGAICAGNVNLILADGAKLTATGEGEQAGIEVSGEGNSLAIYGQTAQSGQLEATGGISAAGIGGRYQVAGSNITINGGLITASGGYDGAGIGGGLHGNGYNIIINGGTVTANGGEGAAGIGGGDRGEGYNITINGGTVTANGHHGGAGIGGGDHGDGYNITINGGIVTAKGRFGGAGIGGGNLGGNGYNITINDGMVTALSGGDAAGIGGGATDGIGSNIYINGGTVKARSGNYLPEAGISAIGNGDNGKSAPGSNIFVATSLVVKAGNSEESALAIYNIENPSPPFGTLDLAGYLAGKLFAIIEPMPVPEGLKEVTYIDEDGTEQTVEAEVVSSSSVSVTWGEPGKTSWYVVTHEDEQLAGAVCQGDVRLILADGAKLTTTGYSYKLYKLGDTRGQKYYCAGIHVSGEGNSLTIYDQPAHTGQLVASGGECSAGIGGNKGADGSNITINGGIITANGGDGETEINDQGGLRVLSGGGAGVGGGDGGAGSNITINGGTVTANGGETKNQLTYQIQIIKGGAGIGGGNVGSGSNIIINDGTVTANGGSSGAGIGGGEKGKGLDITINGGVVTATGVISGVGIGGGNMGSCSNITINGGIVTAIGKDYAAGIGCATPEILSGIFVSPILTLKAGPTANPTDVIENTGGDLAETLMQYHYITVSDAVCNITANQDPNNKKHYYSTFYSSKTAYTVPEGVTAYTGVVDGNVLRLTAIADGIIPAGEPVILRLTTEDKTETLKKFALTATTTTATKSTTNKLKGTDVPIAELGTNDYALTLGQDGVGFYQWENKPIDAHKAYLTLTASAGANAFVFQFEDGETTGILKPVMDEKKAGPAYNLNGVRVNDNYKGIVIKNGKMIYKKK